LSNVRSALVLVALGGVPRLVAAIAMGDGFHFPDEAVYADAARRLLVGAGFGDYRRVPGYPALLAAFWAGLPDSVVWLRSAQAMLTAGGAGLLFVLADRLVGRNVALAAGFMYALDPLLVVAGGLLYPEAVAALVMLGVVLFAWEAARRDAFGYSALAGALLGVLTLLRPVAIALVPVLAPWVAICSAGRPARRLLHACMVAAACLLVLAPWTYRNYVIYGRLIPISLAGTHTAPSGRQEAAREGLASSILDFAREDPLALAAHLAREFGHFWELAPSRLMTDNEARRLEFHRRDPRLRIEPSFPRSLRDRVSIVSFGLELALALAGLVILLRSGQQQAVLLASVVLAYGLGYALFVGRLRYRIPVLPLVFIFAGVAAAALCRLLRKKILLSAASAIQEKSSGMLS
jgi:Dolichyl-phosphate-mannose-protein mannosyltransferase